MPSRYVQQAQVNGPLIIWSEKYGRGLFRELFEERRASVGANRKREPLPRYGGDVIPARQQPGDTEVSVLIHTRSSCPQ
jgi:hypothetical protein